MEKPESGKDTNAGDSCCMNTFPLLIEKITTHMVMMGGIVARSANKPRIRKSEQKIRRKQPVLTIAFYPSQEINELMAVFAEMNQFVIPVIHHRDAKGKTNDKHGCVNSAGDGIFGGK